jgi:hypothetical protein
MEPCITGDAAKTLQPSLSALEFMCGTLAMAIEALSPTVLNDALRFKPLTAKKKWSLILHLFIYFVGLIFFGDSLFFFSCLRFV